ncbi:MAG: phage holin family protein [Vulcanimicrobiota bacterium]
MTTLLSFLLTWVLNALALGVTAALVPGVRIKSFAGAMWGALAIGFVAFLIKPVVLFFSLPFLLVTLGLFYLVVLSFCFWLAGNFAPGFEVDGLLPGFLGAVVLAIVNWLASFFIASPAWW